MQNKQAVRRKVTVGKKVTPEVPKRWIRRMAGLVHRMFSDDLLNRITDPRSPQGRTWKKHMPFLRATLLGLACGCKGLKGVERLTKRLSMSTRKLLGIHKTVPDTTLRDFLRKLDVNELQHLLHVLGYDAWRRKSFENKDEFGLHAISLDGKYPSCKNESDYEFLQHRHDKETGEYLYSLIRTITATLVTAPGRPILGAIPVPAYTNEMGTFQEAFDEMVRIYGKLFELAMYDAGGACEANAKAVRAAGKHYFFQIATESWEIYKTVAYELSDAPVLVESTERLSASKKQVRKIFIIPNVSTAEDGLVWLSARTLIKVESETWENGEQSSDTLTRYFVTSMEIDRLTPEKWLELVVRRWGVETSHQILDVSFEEDKRPWFKKDANGALVVMLMRRLVYTALTLFRSRTQRSEEKRLMPWRELFEDIMDAMKLAADEHVANLRARTYKVPPALA